MEPDYRAAYHILMDYWDCIPEEERLIVDQSLKIALGESEPTTADEYNTEWFQDLAKEVNTGVQKKPNGQLKTISREKRPVPHHKIKAALNRLRDEYGFGEKEL